MKKSKIKSLDHKSVKSRSGAEIIILDPGSVIDAEAAAMLQALHSRSTGGFHSHMEILKKRGAEKFMENFYVGYGHKSIGDLGSTTIFIEGVSMLVAKAIQDWPLYNGQESSTRYIDFRTQPFISPIKSKATQKVLEAWRKFYINAQEKLIEDLKKRFPIQKGEDAKTYDKAISARAFDILRSLLPAGASTNLAWHTNLRQAADKLTLLRHHPLQEVRDVAEAIEKALQQAHPSSFGHKKYEETEKYNELAMQKHYYYHDKNCPDFKLTKDLLNKKMLEEKSVQTLFKKRPNSKTELPKWLAELGVLQFEYQLDFGSYRDLQRHRAIAQRMPLLTMDLGFEQWYLNELPEDLRIEAEKLLKEQERAIRALKLSKEEKQYFVAMGYKVANRISGNLPALVYMAELRSTRFVHPTARSIALKMIASLEKKLGKYGLQLYPDTDPHRFDVRRGKQDIVLKDKK